MEQLIGTPPYRFEALGPDEARIVEDSRKSLLFGGWTKRMFRPRRWVSCRSTSTDTGTLVEVTAGESWGPVGLLQMALPLSIIPAAAAGVLLGLLVNPWVGLAAFVVVVALSAPALVPLHGYWQQPPISRALQLVQLLTRGRDDRRTIYRDRAIPPGPVTLVASWAGMPYRLFTEPDFDAPRDLVIHTATRLTAIVTTGSFVHVRLLDGRTGWVELDQVVPAPAAATREAQGRTALLG
jgi:hypothetical protein